MTRIESQKTNINKSAEEIFTFLSDFNNFQKLMPEQVTNWQSTSDECSFTVSGMASLNLKMAEKKPHEYLKMQGGGKVPFGFHLIVSIERTGDHSCTGQLVFESDMNPMVKMMVEKPLGKFFNLLASKMEAL